MTTAPPFSTTSGPGTPIATASGSISARVLLLHRTSGTCASRSASSAGRAGAKS